jgi:hypothetical protein
MGSKESYVSRVEPSDATYSDEEKALKHLSGIYGTARRGSFSLESCDAPWRDVRAVLTEPHPTGQDRNSRMLKATDGVMRRASETLALAGGRSEPEEQEKVPVGFYL